MSGLTVGGKKAILELIQEVRRPGTVLCVYVWSHNYAVYTIVTLTAVELLKQLKETLWDVRANWKMLGSGLNFLTGDINVSKYFFQ